MLTEDDEANEQPKKKPKVANARKGSAKKANSNATSAKKANSKATSATKANSQATKSPSKAASATPNRKPQSDRKSLPGEVTFRTSSGRKRKPTQRMQSSFLRATVQKATK